MKYTIYKITNKINGKIYIGKHQTNDLNDGYMGSGKILSRSQTKHGLENFVKEILYIFDNEEEMNAKEKELVTEEFCLREDTYNLCVGGQGGFSYINRNGIYYKDYESVVEFNKAHTPFKDREFYDKYKQDHIKGSKLGLEKIAYLRSVGLIDNSHWLGRKHSEESKQKMRQSKNVGKNNSQHGTMWITNGIDNLKINSSDSIPDGWNRGRKMRL